MVSDSLRSLLLQGSEMGLPTSERICLYYLWFKHVIEQGDL